MSYDMKIFKGNIMGFLNFSQRLFPGWNTSGQKFVYVTALNRFLRDKIAAVHDRAERDWLFGCKKNLYAAIQNMIVWRRRVSAPKIWKLLTGIFLCF